MRKRNRQIKKGGKEKEQEREKEAVKDSLRGRECD